MKNVSEAGAVAIAVPAMIREIKPYYRFLSDLEFFDFAQQIEASASIRSKPLEFKLADEIRTDK